MADIRQQAPEVQTSFVDERNARNIRTPRSFVENVGDAAGALAQGLNNIGVARTNELIARQRQAQFDQTMLEQRSADQVAMLYLDDATRLAEEELSRQEIALQAARSRQRSLGEARRQNDLVTQLESERRSVRARLQRYLKTRELITDDQTNAAEIVSELQGFEGQAIGASIASDLDATQSFQIAQQEASLKQYTDILAEYDLDPATPPSEAFRFARRMQDVQNDLQMSTAAYEIARNTSAARTLGAADAFAENRLQVYDALQRVAYQGMNNVLRRFPDLNAVDDATRRLAGQEAIETLEGTVVSMAARYEMSAQEFEQEFPLIGRARDFITRYMSGEMDATEAQAAVDALKFGAERDILSEDGAARAYVSTTMFGRLVETGAVGAMGELAIERQMIPRMEQMTALLAGTYNRMPAPGTTGMAAFAPPRPTIMHVRQGLDFIGMTINSEDFDRLDEVSQLAIEAFTTSVLNNANNPDQVPITVNQDFADWIGSDEGWKAFTTLTEENPEAYNAYMDQFANYNFRLFSKMAEDLNRELNNIALEDTSTLSGLAAGFGLSQPVEGQTSARGIDILDYSVSEDGRVTFRVREPYRGNRYAERQVAEFNKRYGGHLASQLRAFKRLAGFDSAEETFTTMMMQGEDMLGIDEALVTSIQRRLQDQGIQRSPEQIREDLRANR